MSASRRKVRHSGIGPNRHKARVGRRLKLLSERMRDIAIELDLIGFPTKSHELRGAAGIATEWARQLGGPGATP